MAARGAGLTVAGTPLRPRSLWSIMAGAAMFEVVDDGGACVVRGTGGFAGQCARFSGPDARTRAEAYARWMNAGAAFQRRRTDPGFKGRADPEGGGR